MEFQYKLTIKEIQRLAIERRMVIVNRCGFKAKYSNEDLIAKTNLEVELFDEIDGIWGDELKELLLVLEAGGMSGFDSLSDTEIVDRIYLEFDLDKIIEAGLSTLSNTFN